MLYVSLRLSVTPVLSIIFSPSVVRSLCQKPGGLFWAGDTAQTISIGSSFRFDDLKAFLFRIEVCQVFLCLVSSSMSVTMIYDLG